MWSFCWGWKNIAPLDQGSYELFSGTILWQVSRSTDSLLSTCVRSGLLSKFCIEVRSIVWCAQMPGEAYEPGVWSIQMPCVDCEASVQPVSLWWSVWMLCAACEPCI